MGTINRTVPQPRLIGERTKWRRESSRWRSLALIIALLSSSAVNGCAILAGAAAGGATGYAAGHEAGEDEAHEEHQAHQHVEDAD